MGIDFGSRPRIVSCIYLFRHCNFPDLSIEILLLSHHFLGHVGMLGIVPKSTLFQWTLASNVQSSTVWQLSTIKDLIHKAGGEFRDKSLYLELHPERDRKQVLCRKGQSRVDLGNPDGRSQRHKWQC